ncbi:fibrous sheath CABYR-binding protein [Musca vetustissima]|uniref:fibrous sheath CABYR-binding protein n=1 Tax=Musca vetustissima TaxID=27455 RepID=UPI002AB7A1B8|nr:fibrous sheath CABYR-binding protein [Musca vetustissima]
MFFEDDKKYPLKLDRFCSIQEHVTPHPPSENSMLSTTPLPIVLQMSTQHTVEPQATQNAPVNYLSTEMNSGINDDVHTVTNSAVEKFPGKETNKYEPHKTPNDVEVFEQKPGPINQHQEEEGEADGGEEAAPEEEPEAPEAEPEAAEAEPEAAEAEPEPEPANEEEPAAEPEANAEAAPEPEDNPEPEAEEKPEPEAEPPAEEPEETPEAEAEEKPEAVPDTEIKPEDEMQNDAPAPEEGEPEATQATHVTTDMTNNNVNNTKTCYSCNSLEDITCKTKPTTQMNCKSVDSDKNSGHSGCYTIFKADSNMTMRGCVDELAEEGLRDCLTKDKNCILCYSNGCNDKPNAGFRIQMDISVLMLLNGIAFGVMKYL